MSETAVSIPETESTATKVTAKAIAPKKPKAEKVEEADRIK